jgi:parallel beta-helix repeat protein
MVSSGDRRSLVLPAILLALSIGSSMCGSPAAPSTPASPSPSNPATSTVLVLTGTTVLTSTGQTSQLSVKNADGTAYSGAVAWQTSAASVVSVSGTGLVTAAGIGSATVTATSGVHSGAAQVYVLASPQGPATTITACQAITAPGSYVLGSDLGGTATCLNVGPAAAVQIDCRGHLVGGLAVMDVNTVSIANCTVANVADVERVTNVTITNCTLAQGIFLRNGTSVTIANSTITAPQQFVDVINGVGVDLLQDVIHVTSASFGVSFSNGSNNRVRQSTITGGYTGGGALVGPDDGILLEGEDGDTITGNTLSGFYDTGVEGVGTVHDTVISGNTMSTIGTAGIGAYWCTDWVNNTLQGNSVSGAPRLAKILYNVGDACGSATPTASLVGTQFIGNHFAQPTTGIETLVPGAPAARLWVVAPGAASGNVLQNNDFGANDGPSLTPLSAFVDAGGNICGPLNAGVSNFPCSGTASRAARGRRR